MHERWIEDHHISQHTNLEELRIGDNKKITNLNNFPLLKILVIYGMCGVGDQGIKSAHIFRILMPVTTHVSLM